ncbi:L-type lectin-domain containing receptor kinase IX.2 [Lactuca sativa]|uniref:non-specific serine/threonine protein kinase n=1 Tax=Lactuca sativa TaxID=4236 RepID=A0A9R1UE95_LACSA|nr:L-type lectin-domain containing receptor kinase IX.2 [Lactuca sativa]KAJ0185523.1 hypothetical protein LSAT_V11C900502170 [Lactuca sativa]
MSNLTCFLFLLSVTPYAASHSFDFPNITPHENQKIKTSGCGAYISDQGIQVTPENNRHLDNRTAGWATYITPLHLWDKKSKELASFSTHFSFVIDSNNNTDYGDGLTFFLAQNKSMIESDLENYYGGGDIGLPFNSTTNLSTVPFVAVEFDTYYNPSWDATPLDHVGININNLSSVRYGYWWSNITYGKECRASINYDSVSKNLSVSYTNSRDDIDELYYAIDLREVLPEFVIFWFSAATGASFEKNNVRSWTFNSSILHIDKRIDIPPTISPQKIYQNNTLPPSISPDSTKEKKRTGYIVELIAGASVVLALLVIVTIVCWKMRKNMGDEVDEFGSGLEMNNEFTMGVGLRRFSYRELARSTGGFSEKQKLGEGGFGEVYKGFLDELKIYVAVKRVSKNSKQGIKEYAAEVKIISRLRHKNLVQLTGWCHEKGELLLAYEFMENGSLDLHLFNGNSLLAWGTRYKITCGLASALLYLHEDWEQCVLHRDIKSSNVMLDSNFNAKLGDFGLAKLVDHEKGSQTTMLAGTLGYMAPESVVTGKATRESDVFSFGVVALEIACGRKPIVYKAQENQIRLVEWIWELYGNGTLLEGVDPRLGSDYVGEEITRVMILGLWCVHPNPNIRPSM